MILRAMYQVDHPLSVMASVKARAFEVYFKL